MRQTIQRWHVGQLIMAWIVGAVLVGLVGIVGMFTLDAYDHLSFRVSQRAEARQALAGDSVLRADSARWQALLDSAIAIGKDQGNRLLKDRGMLFKSDLASAREALAGPQPPSTTPLVALLIIVGLLILTVPIVLFIMTWVWFGGRAAPPPPPSTA